jgi:60 kDa SS-A/Ro ribonucleoprotein
MTNLDLLDQNAVRADQSGSTGSISAERALRDAVMACSSPEAHRREESPEIADRVAELVPDVEPARVAALAIEAREQMKLRRVPLLLVREMARYRAHRALVAETLARVIQRPDELAEFMAIYWKDGRAPLSGQVKKGLAAAFPKFDEHELATYGRRGPIKLRDVLFLCHAKPRDQAQANLWKRLIWGRLAQPSS